MKKIKLVECISINFGVGPEYKNAILPFPCGKENRTGRGPNKRRERKRVVVFVSFLCMKIYSKKMACLFSNRKNGERQRIEMKTMRKTIIESSRLTRLMKNVNAVNSDDVTKKDSISMVQIRSESIYFS